MAEFLSTEEISAVLSKNGWLANPKTLSFVRELEALVAERAFDQVTFLDRLNVIASTAKSDYQNAWRNVRETLDKVWPGWEAMRTNRLDAACATIQKLKELADEADREERIPFAWTYSLPTAYDPATDEYTAWGEIQISIAKPSLPEYALRDLRPLFLGDEE